MKVYNKIVLDMQTWEVLEEDSFEYSGEVALCKGGGGGGGGSSGKVDYPAYIKVVHANWLGGGSPDGSGMYTLPDGYSITEILYDTMTTNPYESKSAYDPSSRIASMEAGVDAFKQAIDSQVASVESYIDSISTTDGVEAELAKFDAGMQDINAVMSSAFVIGRQLVASQLIETKLKAKLEVARIKAGAYNEYARLAAEVQRLAIVALQEQVEKDLEIDDNYASWRIDKFMDAANVMAVASGGTISKTKGPSKFQSALAGGLAGGAMGYMAANAGMMGSIGGPAGAAIGATLGIGMSLLG